MKQQLTRYQKNLPNEAATEDFGKDLSEAIFCQTDLILEKGLNIRMQGDLGAGKTALTRAVLRAAGFEGRVKSPTFTLLEPYRVRGLILNHFDFYRFEDPEEFEDAGFRENFGAGKICVAEWSEKAGDCLPPADILINIQSVGEGRNLVATAFTDIGRAVLGSLEGKNG